MPTPRFEIPAGFIDGHNRTFYTSVPYRAGSTAVFVNGLLQRADWDSGWDEINPLTGQFDLKEPPFPGDTVQVFFLDLTETKGWEEIRPLTGYLVETEELSGQLARVAEISANLIETELLEGTVRSYRLAATVEDIVPLAGRLTEVI